MVIGGRSSFVLIECSFEFGRSGLSEARPRIERVAKDYFDSLSTVDVRQRNMVGRLSKTILKTGVEII